MSSKLTWSISDDRRRGGRKMRIHGCLVQSWIHPDDLEHGSYVLEQPARDTCTEPMPGQGFRLDQA